MGINMNILCAYGEANPFIATGGLGEVAASFTRSIREKITNCRIVLPLYSDIPEAMRSKMKFLTNFIVPLGWRQQYCGIFEVHVSGTTYYFVDNEYYFKRSGIYGHPDDGERFAFFSRAVLEMIKYIHYPTDIIHSNDWQTGLIPVFYKLLYSKIEEYKNIKTIFTIHNLLYQGQFGLEFFSDVLGLNPQDLSLLEYNGCINLVKAAIETADAVTTVSQTYAEEIKDPVFGYGLDEILRKHSDKITGITNGIDMELYDPETDESILKNYCSNDLSGKAMNKEALQKLFNLPVDSSTPIIGMVTRMVDIKGLDLVREVIQDILCQKVQVVLLGTGDPVNETFFQDIAKKFPAKMAIKIGYHPDIARKIYAGADLFLKPSKSELCGLSQMVALRYGTIPIVRETGGLKDTVIDCEEENGNGFTFRSYSSDDMLEAIERGLDLYSDKMAWESLIKRAMECNNCWQNSAEKYITLYKKLLNQK
ncbi:glycogen synthase GlgA [Anaerocolumna sedimenticola]|nr:glycogen synthase GlgA [Anaerocolumna sedimenticola]